VEKTWREFQSSAQLAIQRFNLNTHALTFVSTVPPQHTYGLETSLFWPLFSAASINSRRPFFPEDIRQSIAASVNPCLLITTPTHIKACVRAGLSWDNIKMVLSSTAPLSPDLAKQAEQCFHAPVFEIIGSTEILSYASRRQTAIEKWVPYQGIKLAAYNDGFTVSGGHLQTPMPVDDRFQIDKNGHFSLKGRSTEIIKVAGKRSSLSELNHIINNIAGVDDAMFFQTGTERLGALVVGNLTKSEILKALKQSIDEVFLPRPLYLVDKIPRNEVGKILKTKLDHLIKEQTLA
jgi:acyl-coenzyme A synthetase/AMP-(fatty) acid ligase